MKVYYTCFLLEDDKHVTWRFGEDATLCTIEGEPVEIRVVGKYKDEIVECDIVKVKLLNGTVLTHQPNGTVLHITTWFDERYASAKDSGLRATENGWDAFYTTEINVGVSTIVMKEETFIEIIKRFFYKLTSYNRNTS